MVTLAKIVSLLPHINLAIIFVLVLDFYLLPTHDILEKPDHEMFERSLSGIQGSYLTYSIVSKSGHKYHLPEKLERLIPMNADFYIQQTCLLRLQSQIVCHTANGLRKFKIGYVNSNEMVQILIAGLLVISIYNLIYPGRENANTNLMGLSILSYFVLIIIGLFG
jgi:hypothetical protein